MPAQRFTGKVVVAASGGPGAGKTYSLVGKKCKKLKLGSTHQGHDCVMSRSDWREGIKLPRIYEDDIRADACRIVEFTPRSAYLWSFDGHHNLPGYREHLTMALQRYDAVYIDSIFALGSPVLAWLIERGCRVLAVQINVAERDRIAALKYRAEQDTKQVKRHSPEQWAGYLPDLLALQRIGVELQTVEQTVAVDELVKLLR